MLLDFCSQSVRSISRISQISQVSQKPCRQHRRGFFGEFLKCFFQMISPCIRLNNVL